MMQRIEDVEGLPVVGKFYLVPCVRINASVWPILGEFHNDKEIGIEYDHWHYDHRFTSSYQFDRDPYPYAMIRIKMRKEHDLVETLARKCRRQMPDFPSRLRINGGKTHVAITLERNFKDVKMKCLTCPHRGFSLKGVPNKNGIIVCPGHGLAWEVESGRMIERND